MTPEIEKAAKELKTRMAIRFSGESTEDVIAHFLDKLFAQERAKVWEEAAATVYRLSRNVDASPDTMAKCFVVRAATERLEASDE